MRWLTARLSFYDCAQCGNHHLTRIGCWIYGSTPMH